MCLILPFQRVKMSGCVVSGGELFGLRMEFGADAICDDLNVSHGIHSRIKCSGFARFGISTSFGTTPPRSSNFKRVARNFGGSQICLNAKLRTAELFSSARNIPNARRSLESNLFESAGCCPSRLLERNPGNRTFPGEWPAVRKLSSL